MGGGMYGYGAGSIVDQKHSYHKKFFSGCENEKKKIVNFEYWRWSEPNGFGRREKWQARKIFYDDGSVKVEANYKFLGYS